MRAWYGSIIGAALMLAVTATAEAQTRRAQAGSPSGVGAAGPTRSPGGRAPEFYSQPAGRSGTIGPSTPNASGNLGGPGTGGGGGNGS